MIRAAEGTGSALEAVAWRHVTRRVVALGHDFTVRTTDPDLGRYLDVLFEALAVPGVALRTYSLVDRGSPAHDRFTLDLDGACIARVPSADLVLAHLLWHVNQTVAGSVHDQVVLHAGGVDLDGTGVVFPAPAGSGKSTLVAGLLTRGAGYLSDEAIVVDARRGAWGGYPKALSLCRGSWEVLPDLAAGPPPEIRHYVDDEWHVPPSAFGTGRVAVSSAAAVVVACRYEPGAATTVAPLGRADALTVLAANSFNFRQLGADGLRDLAVVVRRCACFRMVVGELAAACDLVHEAAARVAAP